MKLSRMLVVVFQFLFGLVIGASEPPVVIPLWSDRAPGSEHLDSTETITERSKNPARPDRIYTRITAPSLTVLRPEHPNGTAVVLAPGGGYRRIVIDKEGPDTSAWLNSLGVTVFLLKYRLPFEGHDRAVDVPLMDAQRAIRTVRARATEWGIDPQRVGFLGYSAGGHLAASVAFWHGEALSPLGDAVEGCSARPDFVILGYPWAGPLRIPAGEGSEAGGVARYGISPEAVAGLDCPPLFVFHADDDPSVPPTHSLRIAEAAKSLGAPVELHLFAHGGHGFAIRDAVGPVARWPELCALWMRGRGWVD